jgi:hypothetical protein
MRCHSLPRREVFRGCSWVFRGFPSRWVKWRETPRKSLLLTMVALSGFEPEFRLRSRLRHFCRVVTLSEAAKNPVRLKHERVIVGSLGRARTTIHCLRFGGELSCFPVPALGPKAQRQRWDVGNRCRYTLWERPMVAYEIPFYASRCLGRTGRGCAGQTGREDKVWGSTCRDCQRLLWNLRPTNSGRNLPSETRA